MIGKGLQRLLTFIIYSNTQLTKLTKSTKLTQLTKLTKLTKLKNLTKSTMIRHIFKRNTLITRGCINQKPSYQPSPFISHSSDISSHRIYYSYPLLPRVFAQNFSSVKVSHLINPYNKQLVSDKEYISDQLIEERITKVSQQQKQWKKVPLPKRIQLVQKFIDSVLNDQQQLSKVMIKEIGKSIKDIRQQFAQLRDEVPLLLGDGLSALQAQTISQSDQGIVKIVLQPIGVTMIFPHYSEPIFDSMIHLIPCLVSGCGALIKPSDYNHSLGEYLQKKVKYIIGFDLVADLFIEPQDLCKFQITLERQLKKVVYSGSHTSAKHIFEVLTEKRFIDCNMYFGGQDTVYVDQTADLEEVIQEIMRTAFANNGQAYDSIKRLYVKEPVYENVINLLKQKMMLLKLGDPADESTDLGPLAIPEAASNLQQLVNEAISLGAKCQVGGMITSVQTGVGIYFEPTLITDLTDEMSILQTHSPAPILCCFAVSNDDEFLSRFNDNRFGAKVKIFTRHDSPKQIYSRYQYLIDNLQIGSIIINHGSVHTSNRRLQSWKASTNNRKSSSRIYEEYTIPKVFDI